jgi:hypothetical protein
MQDHANALFEINDIWPGDIAYHRLEPDSPIICLTVCYNGSDKLEFGVKSAHGLESCSRHELMTAVEAEIKRITGK